MPVVAHVDAEVPRHAVEQAVLRVETLAADLPEHKRREQRLQLVKLVIAQSPDRFIQSKVVNVPGRELRPDRLIRSDLEAKPSGKQSGLTFKDGIGALRFGFLRQSPHGFM